MTIAFAYTRRPARAHHLPDPAHLMFMLGGVVRPAEPPAVRVRSATRWQPAAERYLIGMAHDDQLSAVDVLAIQYLQLASVLSAVAYEVLRHSTATEAYGVAAYGIATTAKAAPHIAAWGIATTADQHLQAAWGTASPTHRDAIESTSLLRELDGLSGDRLWHVNLKDRPFDPRYDLVPPLHQLPGQLLVANLSPGNQPPAPSTIKFSWHHDTTVRSIYPRNSATAAAGMGISAEADQQSTGKWGTAGWYSHGGQPGWGDDSNGEIGNMDPPTEPMEAPYSIMNSIQCFALVGDERIAIAPDNIKVGLLIENYAWELTADLYGRTSVNYLRPDSEGPKHIELMMNGNTWLFAIKSYQSKRSLSGEAYSFIAHSRSMLLDGDQADKITVTVSSAIGAWQLAEQVLHPLGFTIERPIVAEWIQSPEWTLAANSASWVAVTPMQIVSDIAKACGAVITPHLTEDKLIIMPRYRVSPGLWGIAQASAWSHQIPEGVIPTEGCERQYTTPLERVLIAGTTHGVVTEVIRSGSAGAVSAGDVSDVLAQDVAANTERGRNILAESGQIEILSLEMPLLPPGQSPGLIVPGQLVKILREDGSVTRGLALANNISPNGISAIWQNVSLEVHNGNR